MAEINERIEAELENIRKVLSKFPPDSSCQHLSTLEIAGIATLIHNFYNGLENIIKQIVRHKEMKLPTGPSWHRDLLKMAVSSGMISEMAGRKLKRYLAFRNYFIHGYAFELEASKLELLVRDIEQIHELFEKDISVYLDTVNQK